jgi:hypothetical protein
MRTAEEYRKLAEKCRADIARAQSRELEEALEKLAAACEREARGIAGWRWRLGFGFTCPAGWNLLGAAPAADPHPSLRRKNGRGERIAPAPQRYPKLLKPITFSFPQIEGAQPGVQSGAHTSRVNPMPVLPTLRSPVPTVCYCPCGPPASVIPARSGRRAMGTVPRMLTGAGLTRGAAFAKRELGIHDHVEPARRGLVGEGVHGIRTETPRQSSQQPSQRSNDGDGAERRQG